MKKYRLNFVATLCVSIDVDVEASSSQNAISEGVPVVDELVEAMGPTDFYLEGFNQSLEQEGSPVRIHECGGFTTENIDIEVMDEEETT